MLPKFIIQMCSLSPLITHLNGKFEPRGCFYWENLNQHIATYSQYVSNQLSVSCARRKNWKRKPWEIYFIESKVFNYSNLRFGDFTVWWWYALNSQPSLQMIEVILPERMFLKIKISRLQTIVLKCRMGSHNFWCEKALILIRPCILVAVYTRGWKVLNQVSTSVFKVLERNFPNTRVAVPCVVQRLYKH